MSLSSPRTLLEEEGERERMRERGRGEVCVCVCVEWRDGKQEEESISRSVRRGSGKAGSVMNLLTFGITIE